MQHINLRRISAIFLLLSLVAISMTSCNEDKLDVNAIGILDGTVMDFTSEENVSGVVLTTNPPTISVASDSAGYFIFKTIDDSCKAMVQRKSRDRRKTCFAISGKDQIC